MNLKSLNDSSHEEAMVWFREQILESTECDGWIDGILQRRPFASLSQLEVVAEESWRNLSNSQRIHMMNGHPEIGMEEATAGDPNGMEAQEQQGMVDAPPDLVAQIDANKAGYKEKFGFIYMIFATGLSAEDLALALTERLQNTQEEELQTATTEFWRIHQKRLADKLDPPQSL